MFTLKQDRAASDYVKWMTNEVFSFSVSVKWQKEGQYQLISVYTKKEFMEISF